MTDDEYGYITFRDREIVTIGDVPQRTIIPPDLLFDACARRGVHIMESGVVMFGRHEDGGHVWYHIATGIRCARPWSLSWTP